MYTMTATKDFEPVITEDAKPILAPNARWEREYNALLNAVTKEVERIVRWYSPNDPNTSIEVIRGLQKYAEKLNDWAKGKIGGIIYNLNDDSEKKWKKQSVNISKFLRIEMEKAPIKGLLKQYMEENVKLIKSVPLNAAKKIEKIVLENLKTGAERAESLTDIVMQIGKLPESMRSRAKLIARTEIAKMSTGLVKARAVSSDINWYVWRSTHDIRVRSSHKLMDKVLVAWDDPASPEELDGAKKSYGHYHPGEIFNCFQGSTQVSLLNGYDCIWQRDYVGQIVTVVFSDGSFFSSTPNHPVLTKRGWIPVNMLQNGDDVINTSSDLLFSGKENIDKTITSFDNLFITMKSFFGAYRTFGSEFDFHGDGTKGDVDIVFTNPLLRKNFISSGLESLCDFILTNPESRIRTADFIGGDQQIIKSLFSGSMDDVSSFFNRQFLHLDRIGNRSISQGDVISDQNISDSPSEAMIRLAQGRYSAPLEIVENNPVFRDVCSAIKSGTFDLLKNKSIFTKTSGDDVRIDSDDLSNFFQSEGRVFDNHCLCTVDKITTDFFHGKVYGLQSLNGWYIINDNYKKDNKIIVKNCRCYPRPLIRVDDVSWPAKVHRNGKIVMMKKSDFIELSAGQIPL